MPAGKFPPEEKRERKNPTHRHPEAFFGLRDGDGTEGLRAAVSPRFPPETPSLSRLLWGPQHPYLNCLFGLKLLALCSCHLQLKSLD